MSEGFGVTGDRRGAIPQSSTFTLDSSSFSSPGKILNVVRFFRKLNLNARVLLVLLTRAHILDRSHLKRDRILHEKIPILASLESAK
jgi:hypothetical protein